jgi:hypothetical protein
MNGSQLGTTIRQPSVANLMIDSADRSTSYPSPWDFQIVKKQSLFNGYFTRIGATEVVLEWNNPNIVANVNDKLAFTIAASGTQPTSVEIQYGDGFGGYFTVADILNATVASLNEATAANRFAVVSLSGLSGINDTVVSGGDITVADSPLKTQMGFGPSSGTTFLTPIAPDLRPYRYLDFVSSQLTYNQSLKDATSNLRDQSVLLRWYFAYDTPTPSDEYNFPVLMGYEPFCLRRLYNPPKQIAWENNMPIGNLSFQVYGNDGNLVKDTGDNTNWMMTLQISEN